MKIDNLSNLNFNAKVSINVKENIKRNPYLYNQVLDIMGKYKLPGNWNNETINLPDVPQKALSDLKELGITFIKNA